ncbi:alpha/beta hydrolase [Rubrivirga sp. IMCC43871]|uniref:alpha/beta hydrolase n=1 Tax=Rubrivirga sp. IMCC43871 TaxID=3391575 RepID=UPI0039901D77
MRAFALALALAASGCVTVAVGPEHVLHPRLDTDTSAPALDAAAVVNAVPGATVEPFDVATDSAVLAGWRVRHAAPDDARPTVLYFGGNGFRISQLGLKKLVPLLRTGVDVVLIDHRGHGRSTGEASTHALKADALATFDAVAALVGPERVIVHGHSLGSFLASHVGAERATAGVVLENSATTTADYAASRFDLYPVFRPFVRLEVSDALADEGSLAPVRRIDEPLLILAGALDARIPAWMSEELYAASPLAPGRKRLVVFETAGHNRVPFHPDFAAVYRAFVGDWVR